jgi:hypothetical protein
MIRAGGRREDGATEGGREERAGGMEESTVGNEGGEGAAR